MDISSISPVGGIPQSYPDRLSLGTVKVIGDTVEIKGGVPAEHAENLPSKEIERQELKKSIEGLNKLMQSSNTHLSFVLHDRLNEYYVQVVDDRTQKVIREVPSKKMLDMVAEMKSMIGLLIDEKR
ncbi:flagellar protein FlaG [Paenibacillus alkaliterrae]|uniref:flagellar protein FlaG n=1 Tax=Paenibacillus alkaliterrae TaxID=320909 RepID=UPI001F446958|nr:flagellar protein FlaG [Paenibacillus alkaliterrae]MCF2941400.1 flagellar protein FlaG [Paenibacillus alkaliterrae]